MSIDIDSASLHIEVIMFTPEETLDTFDRGRGFSWRCVFCNIWAHLSYSHHTWFVHVSPTLDNITEINSGGSGHPIITPPLYLISVLVSMAMAYPKASHQIIIFSLGSAAWTTIQPTPPSSQVGLIKRLAEDFVSPGARLPQTESQLVSEPCVFTLVLAVLLIIEIFEDKQHLLLFQLLILTYHFLLLLSRDKFQFNRWWAI